MHASIPLSLLASSTTICCPMMRLRLCFYAAASALNPLAGFTRAMTEPWRQIVGEAQALAPLTVNRFPPVALPPGRPDWRRLPV
jgi:hypothetical protein